MCHIRMMITDDDDLGASQRRDVSHTFGGFDDEAMLHNLRIVHHEGNPAVRRDLEASSRTHVAVV